MTLTVLRDYVVQTHPCFEMTARANLESRGFAVYLPTVIEEIRTGRNRERRSTVVTPLFPGYLFAALDLARDAWREISAVRGVKRILGRDAEHPTPLPAGALADLKERFLAGEFVRRDAVYQVRAGDTVLVRAGAFEGHSGVCTVARGERIKVLLSRLSGAFEVEMPVAMVSGENAA